jgi:DNA-binding transcriptional LysR family regulator
MDLNARAYRCFVTVADERSFTRAAERLNMSQPALSGQIRELERRLGFSLFTRTSRHVELTSRGRLFMPNARRFISETDIINRAARDIRSNELRLGAALQTELIPERCRLIETFMGAHPDVPLQILNDHPLRLVRSLARREVDIAISVEPSPQTQMRVTPSTTMREQANGVLLEQLILSEKPIELVLPSEHPLASGDLPLEALRGLAVVVPSRFHGVPLSDAITFRLSEFGAVPVRPPEGHAIAVERYGRFRRIAAIALNWFEPSTVEEDRAKGAFVKRSITDFGLSTGLALTRFPGNQRAVVDQFWRDTEQWAQAGGFADIARSELVAC